MKKTKQLILAGIGLCAAAAVAVYWKLHRQSRKTASAVEPVLPKPETPEEVFLREWTTALAENARTFNGLFSGLWRVQSGNAKKPEKVLREWCQRTHYKFENQPVDTLSQEQILPLIEAEDREGLTKWAGLLLDAAAVAGITKEDAATLVLTESSAGAYVEWNGEELYPDDEIEVITPAWYQNGKLLEQGQCKVISTEEE